MNNSKAIQSAHIHAATTHAKSKADAVEVRAEPTPGPWIVQPREGPAFAENIISTMDGRVIAMALCGIRGDFATAESNALLLAAAPELLAAIESCIGPLQDEYNRATHTGHATNASQAFLKATQAIRKAKKGSL